MRVTGYMHNDKTRVRVIGGSKDGAFINLDFGDDLTISLPGYGAESAIAARTFAAQLSAAADALDAIPADRDENAAALIGEFV